MLADLELRIRQLHWPAAPGDEPVAERHCLEDKQRAVLRSMLRQHPRGLYLEIGSMCGTGSTKLVLEEFPETSLICLDLFPAEWLSGFRRSTWAARDRIRAIPGPSRETLPLVYEAGLRPDVIWIDGSHEEADVYFDVTFCLQHFFPHALIAGDDWTSPRWPGVRAAVERVVAEGLIPAERLGNNGRCWYLLPLEVPDVDQNG